MDLVLFFHSWVGSGHQTQVLVPGQNLDPLRHLAGPYLVTSRLTWAIQQNLVSNNEERNQFLIQRKGGRRASGKVQWANVLPYSLTA